MIDLKELYEQGHRRFLFSDGVVREPEEVSLWSAHPMLFWVPDNKQTINIYYKNDGTNNIGDPELPHIVGVPGENPQNVNLQKHDGRWWLEVPHSATVHDITKAAEVLNNV